MRKFSSPVFPFIAVVLVAAAIFSLPERMTVAEPAAAADPPGKVFRDSDAGQIMFLCDATASMLKKMAALKSEIKKSIGALKPSQSFNMIFFKDVRVTPFQPTLVAANAENKRKAETYLDGVTAGDTTDPIPAMIVALKQKPEVIYFVTVQTLTGSSEGIGWPARHATKACSK